MTGLPLELVAHIDETGCILGLGIRHIKHHGPGLAATIHGYPLPLRSSVVILSASDGKRSGEEFRIVGERTSQIDLLNGWLACDSDATCDPAHLIGKFLDRQLAEWLVEQRVVDPHTECLRLPLGTGTVLSVRHGRQARGALECGSSVNGNRP